MNQTSTAYILVKALGYRYSFDGITSLSHSLSLKISTDSESAQGDTVNNARNEPDVVTLSVVASDTHVAVDGWARQTMESLCQIKEYRLLCRVVTSLRSYDNMLLSAISVLQDENSQSGWTGTLTFTHAEPQSAAKSADNSSTPVSSGSAAAKNLGSQSGSVLQTILREAGIR